MRLSLSLRGPWWGWALAGILATLWVLGLLLAPRDLDEGAREILRAALASAHLRGGAAAGRPWEAMSPGEREALSARAVESERIRILSLDVRGLGSRVAVRVRYSLDGREATRCFAMDRSALFGWVLRQEIPAPAYYLTLW